jgi:hypothetical protein
MLRSVQSFYKFLFKKDRNVSEKVLTFFEGEVQYH